MRSGRGAAGAGGKELVSEEKEPGEEQQRQDEAAEGQCAIGSKVNDDNNKEKKVKRGEYVVAWFRFSAASGNKNSVTDDSFRQSGDEITQVPCCEKIDLEAV